MAPRLAIIREAPRKVLDASQDAGGLSDALRAACPKASLWLLNDEPAPAMVWWQRVADGWGRNAPQRMGSTQLASAGADLLWANMRLHLAPDPLVLLKTWQGALAAEGFVMFSTVGPGSLRQLRDVYHREGWGVPHLPFVDMHDLGDMMVEAGFADPVMDQEVVTLTYANPQALLAEMREWGLNVAPGRHPGCRGRAWLGRLHEALAAGADQQGRISMDMELVYGHAFRAPDRGPAVSERTTIDLQDMKLMLRHAKTRK